MKKACSPVIVLLDVLFIFIIIAILQSPAKVEIIVPEHGRFPNSEIVFLEQGVLTAWYDSGAWKGLESLGEKYGGFYTLVECNNECNYLNLPVNTQGSLKIALLGNLYDEMSRILFAACKVDGDECSDLKITVNNEGKVDIGLLNLDNPIVRTIPGLGNNANQNGNT